ncbi:MAG: zinc metalloprotease [Ferruginibacter sp.]
MKKIFPTVLLLWLINTGCTKTNDTEKVNTENVTASLVINRTCASADILSAQLAADPGLRARREALETFTRSNIANNLQRNAAVTSITIPVVVNVVYYTAAENISLQQIQSQIDVLNEDFNKKNKDVTGVPSVFKPVVADVGINFVLSEVVRRQSNRKAWPPVDGMKHYAGGGIDATDPEHKLNMWSCNLGQNLLGYAYYPGTVSPTIDGVVILYSAFGSREKFPGGTYINNYDLGRTATHEVGHWVNLIHIWGDDGGSCSGSDMVDDTPNQASENYRCPVFPSVSCNNNGDMSMNYMDYTYDRCMFMFSKGQADRSLAVFAPGGPRVGYIQ